MRRSTRVLVPASTILAALLAPAMPALGQAAAQPAAAADMGALAQEKLPNSPDLVIGQLDNGVKYVIKKHSNPPGRISIQMLVSTGSLNESEDQRGLAHYMEHMAFNGSEHFPPGQLIPAFEGLGLTFGRHQNANTSFDRTLYILDLPNTKDETIVKGLTFFSDVLGRLSLVPEEIDKERQVILEEKRTGLGPDQRLRDIVFPRIFGDSLIAKRLPIGVEETLLKMGPKEFNEYYKKWYTTGNATVMAVGDIDPEKVVELIKQTYGDLKGAPEPKDADVNITPYTKSFAVVATDKELTRCDVQLIRISDPLGPTLTAADLRRDLVNQIGSFAFNRRLQAKVAAGDVSFRSGGAGASDAFRAVRFASVQCTGKPDQWKPMLTDLVEELQRARTFGFTDREIQDAQKDILAQTKQLAAMEATLPANFILRFIYQGVNEGEPIMSAQQTLSYMERLLPTINAGEVSANFKSTFDPDACAFIVEMPSGDGVPSESELLEAGTEAVHAKVVAEADQARPEKLMDKLPEPGKVVEQSMHPATQVWSGRLSNNSVVHHRYMDYRKDSATITITLAGGQIEETPENRGVTEAASVAMSRPATSALTSTNIRDLLTGKNVAVVGRATPDAVVITVTGNPADLESGMQVAHLLLTDPVIEQAGFDQWKQQQTQAIEARKQQPTGVMSEMVPDVMYPKDDLRMRPLEESQVASLTRDEAQKWLKNLVAHAPIEVSVVGDIQRDKALELLTRYIGSLPSREAITSETLDSLRAMNRPPGPHSREVNVATQTKQAMVMSGFYGVDLDDVRDVRLMRMASQILSTRMIKQIREEEQLVYGIRAFSQPAQTIPGFGFFGAGAPTEPAKAPKLAAAIDEMFAQFAENGPTEEEITVAKGQIANSLDETMKEPGYWTGELSDLVYRGTKLDDINNDPAAFQAITATEVRDAFRKYYTPDNAIRITVMPVEGAGS